MNNLVTNETMFDVFKKKKDISRYENVYSSKKFFF